MKILLLGGTGAMGTHLTDILTQDKNNHVFITSRRHLNSSENVIYINGNAHDMHFLKEIIQNNWDVIVDFMVYNTEEFQNRVETLLQYCKQYIFISSSRVYAESSTPITEACSRLLDICKDPEYLTTDEYALTKARQEDILINTGKNNWTIIRPYITYSENRLQLGFLELHEWLYRALLGHAIVFSSDIAEKHTTMTYGYDVARGIASIIGKSAALTKTFHITQSETLKWKEILDIYSRIIEKETGKRPKVKIVDEHPYIKENIRKYQIIYDRRYNREFNNSSIANFIDVSSFLTVEKGLEKALSKFIQSNKDFNFNLNPSYEGFYDRITGDKMDLDYFHDHKSKLIYLITRYTPYLKNPINKINKMRRLLLRIRSFVSNRI